MVRIKTLSVIIILLTLRFTNLQAQEVKHNLTWYTDVNQVYKVSNETHKPVFAFFTGSDWCVWCKRMEANIFDKPGFQAWAKKNVVLLELDYPRTKELPEALQKQNEELRQFFKVQSFPTVWIFNMNKDEKANKFNISGLGTLGYPGGANGKEESVFIDNLNTIMKHK